VAKVKNGFVPRVRDEVFPALEALQALKCPFANLPGRRTSRWGETITAERMSECRWVKPKLVCKVAFLEWTDAGHLRHCTFVGMRDDKKATQWFVRLESLKLPPKTPFRTPDMAVYAFEFRMSFKKRSYTEWLECLEAARAWLEINHGRVAQYRQLITDFYEKGVRSPAHFLAVGESWEIVRLFGLWKDRVVAFPGLTEKLRKVFAKGPALREEENLTTASNRPRNDAFVYLVAGTLLSAGVHVVAVDGTVAGNECCRSEADVTFRWEDLLINVECKRPQSQAGLGKLTKEARGQIEDPSRGGHHGVIALDCSVLVRPRWNLLECDSEKEAVSSRESVFDELQGSISPKIRSQFARSILGFILFAKVPAKIRVYTSPL
jgi:hypothetical protein